LYCKICPKVENIHLKSIEYHIRLKDPQHHKAKLLEILQKEKEINDKDNKDKKLSEYY